MRRRAPPDAPRFRDRGEAGLLLGERLATMDLRESLVLALPRGGVPVGAEVARLLEAPLDVLVARKVGDPRQPEFALGAIAEGRAEVVWDRASGTTASRGLEPVIEAERAELARRVERYRGDRPLPSCEGRDVVLVDDGLATGATALAACLSLQARHPRRVLVAAPVCAPQARERLLDGAADEVVCLVAPSPFVAVGLWYERFDQLGDEEVVGLLARSRNGSG